MSQNTSPDNVPSAKHGTADSVAAPGRVGAGGTTLEQFQRWLETRAHEAARAEWPSSLAGESVSNHEFRCNAMIHSCREATALLMMFKMEQGA